jgi:hypothetical protein
MGPLCDFFSAKAADHLVTLFSNLLQRHFQQSNESTHSFVDAVNFIGGSQT